MNAGWARIVRAGFWLLYNPFAWTYDAVSWLVSMGAWRAWTMAALVHMPAQPGHVLEIAHGPGHVQRALAERGVHAVGLDRSRAMGRLAAHRLRRGGFAQRLVLGDAYTLPFPDGAFTCVISTFPTGFIVAPTALREIYRVLAPGGRAVIVPGAGFTSGGAVRAVLEWAYRVTGQQNPDVRTADPAVLYAPMLTHFAAFGFTPSVHAVSCPRSIAYVLVLERGG
jgi:ubiquinone/menaquinone biosynthesis C-methylase UbiE